MLYTMSYNRNTITLNTETGDITGSTYQMRDAIKDDLYAKWNPVARVWHSDSLAETIERYRDYLTRCYSLKPVDTSAAKPAAREAFIAKAHGLCPRCHTYCYGDCMING